jgi:hypothetical protein
MVIARGRLRTSIKNASRGQQSFKELKFVDSGARRAYWIVVYLILYVCHPNGDLALEKPAAFTDPS